MITELGINLFYPKVTIDPDSVVTESYNITSSSINEIIPGAIPHFNNRTLFYNIPYKQKFKVYHEIKDLAKYENVVNTISDIQKRNDFIEELLLNVARLKNTNNRNTDGEVIDNAHNLFMSSLYINENIEQKEINSIKDKPSFYLKIITDIINKLKQQDSFKLFEKVNSSLELRLIPIVLTDPLINRQLCFYTDSLQDNIRIACTDHLSLRNRIIVSFSTINNTGNIIPNVLSFGVLAEIPCDDENRYRFISQAVIMGDVVIK